MSLKKITALIMLLSLPSFAAQAMTLSGSQLFSKFAHPIRLGGPCTGFTFITPAVNNFISLGFFFNTGSVTGSICSTSTVIAGNVNFTNICVDGIQAKGGTTYCVNAAGLSELSQLAGADTWTNARCAEIEDGNTGGSAAVTVSCLAQGNCSYTGAVSGTVTSLSGGVCGAG